MRLGIAMGIGVLGFSFISGCSNVPGDPGFAGHPLDCAVGFYHADCAPESTAGQRSAAINNSEDAQCQSYGLQWGTPAYAQCRQNIVAQRNANALAAMSILQANRPAPPPYQLPMPAPPPRTLNTNCQNYGTTTSCQTN